MSPEAAMPVLVVEDHPVNRNLLVRQLTLLGYRVEAVANGEEALDRCARRSYRVLLTDLHLPGMSGVQLAQAVRERTRGDSCPPVIIAVTGETEPRELKRLRDAGVDDALIKPLDMHELGACLAGWVTNGADVPLAGTPSRTLEDGLPDLDEKVLGGLLGEEAGADAERLVRMFAESARAGFEGAAHALAARDVRDLKRYLHRQWSAAGAIGAARFAMLAGWMESALNGGQWRAVEAQWAALESALERIEHRAGILTESRAAHRGTNGTVNRGR